MLKGAAQDPLWLLDIPKPKALLVVTHADDETIFAGGLILSSREARWTVICAYPQGQQRKDEFLSACHFLAEESGNRIDPILLHPVLNSNGEINADWLINKLKSYRVGHNFVLTHNSKGEYGNANHKVVHRCVIKSIANPNTWLFISPGSTNACMHGHRAKPS